jgi:uncharacterized cupin superfamily protein
MKINVTKPSDQQKTMVKSWPIWQKEVSRFPWEYTESEQCLIVSGKATVTTENGETVRFAAGDFVEFPLGLKCTWQITEPITKHYHFG